MLLTQEALTALASEHQPADIAKANLEVTNDNNFSEFVDSKVNDAVLETQVDSKISDIRDVKEMVDLEKKRQKAEADSKKKGINMVPDAKETLEQTEARMEEIRSKYSKVDGRTKDVRAREKTKGDNTITFPSLWNCSKSVLKKAI